jgi:hypothetical protein
MINLKIAEHNCAPHFNAKGKYLYGYDILCGDGTLKNISY